MPPSGRREKRLARIAGGNMRKRGMPEGAIETALLEKNRLRYDPPLGEREVQRNAASIASYKPASNNGPTNASVSDRWITGADPEHAFPVLSFSEGFIPKRKASKHSGPDSAPVEFHAFPILSLMHGLSNRLILPVGDLDCYRGNNRRQPKVLGRARPLSHP